MDWTAFGYIVVGIVSANIGRLLSTIIRQELKEYRERRVIAAVKFKFPDAGGISVTTVATSDRKALKDIERQLRGADLI